MSRRARSESEFSPSKSNNSESQYDSAREEHRVSPSDEAPISKKKHNNRETLGHRKTAKHSSKKGSVSKAVSATVKKRHPIQSSSQPQRVLERPNKPVVLKLGPSALQRLEKPQVSRLSSDAASYSTTYLPVGSSSSINKAKNKSYMTPETEVDSSGHLNPFPTKHKSYDPFRQ